MDGAEVYKGQNEGREEHLGQFHTAEWSDKAHNTGRAPAASVVSISVVSIPLQFLSVVYCAQSKLYVIESQASWL